MTDTKSVKEKFYGIENEINDCFQLVSKKYGLENDILNNLNRKIVVLDMETERFFKLKFNDNTTLDFHISLMHNNVELLIIKSYDNISIVDIMMPVIDKYVDYVNQELESNSLFMMKGYNLNAFLSRLIYNASAPYHSKISEFRLYLIESILDFKERGVLNHILNDYNLRNLRNSIKRLLTDSLGKNGINEDVVKQELENALIELVHNS